jgi:hypothetical protein
MSLGLCRREYRQRSCGSFRPDLCNRAEPVLPRGTWLASTAGESPPGETGLSHGEAGRGTSRFMSRSMDADKGSTDDRAGSGPRPSLLVRWLGALGLGVIWRNRFARPVLRFGRSPMPRIFLSQKIADVRFRAMACCYGNEPGTAAVLGMKLRLGHFKNTPRNRPNSDHPAAVAERAAPRRSVGAGIRTRRSS